MPPIDLFHRIDDPLYVDCGQSIDQIRLDTEQYSRFRAIPVGALETFDGWVAYLIEGDSIAKLLCNQRWRDYSSILNVQLLSGEFDCCIGEMPRYLRSNCSVT